MISIYILYILYIWYIHIHSIIFPYFSIVSQPNFQHPFLGVLGDKLKGPFPKTALPGTGKTCFLIVRPKWHQDSTSKSGYVWIFAENMAHPQKHLQFTGPQNNQLGFSIFSMEHNTHHTHLFSDRNWATCYGNMMNKDPGDVEQLDEHKPKALTGTQGLGTATAGSNMGQLNFGFKKWGGFHWQQIWFIMTLS